MKMKNFRKIALLIAACLCLSLLSGCFGEWCDECHKHEYPLHDYEGKELCDDCYAKTPKGKLWKAKRLIREEAYWDAKDALELCNDVLKTEPDNSEAKELLEKAQAIIDGKNTPKPASTPKPATVSDVILSDAEAVAVAEDIVRKNLKSPSSAKFCIMSEATVMRLDNGEYCVGGWVEAQNGYGATIRSTYLVTFTPLRERDKFGYKNPSCDIF